MLSLFYVLVLVVLALLAITSIVGIFKSNNSTRKIAWAAVLVLSLTLAGLLIVYTTNNNASNTNPNSAASEVITGDIHGIHRPATNNEVATMFRMPFSTTMDFEEYNLVFVNFVDYTLAADNQPVGVQISQTDPLTGKPHNTTEIGVPKNNIELTMGDGAVSTVEVTYHDNRDGSSNGHAIDYNPPSPIQLSQAKAHFDYEYLQHGDDYLTYSFLNEGLGGDMPTVTEVYADADILYNSPQAFLDNLDLTLEVNLSEADSRIVKDEMDTLDNLTPDEREEALRNTYTNRNLD